MHCRGDARVPIEEAKYITASIPDARLELLDSDNHIPLAQEPAFGQMMERFNQFMAENETASGSTLSTDFASLTPRELSILEGVARGHDNCTIAAHLGIADKTVRNNLSLIYDKLGVRTRAQAIVNARNAGIGV
jgi:DNA-binding NarL/FixJ family response regulator